MADRPIVDESNRYYRNRVWIGSYLKMRTDRQRSFGASDRTADLADRNGELKRIHDLQLLALEHSRGR
jgi:hypothetical protein